MNLQKNYELEMARRELSDDLAHTRPRAVEKQVETAVRVQFHDLQKVSTASWGPTISPEPARRDRCFSIAAQRRSVP